MNFDEKKIVGIVMKWHKNRFHYDGGHEFVFEHDFHIFAQRLHHQIENMYDLFVAAVNGYHHQFSRHSCDEVENQSTNQALFPLQRRKKKSGKQCMSEFFFIVHKSLRKLCTIYYLLSNSNGAMYYTHTYHENFQYMYKGIWFSPEAMKMDSFMLIWLRLACMCWRETARGREEIEWKWKFKKNESHNKTTRGCPRVISRNVYENVAHN